MAQARPTNLYAFLTQRGSVSRMGEITVMVMDGSGGIVTPTLSFSQAMRWAQARQASGNLQKDRAQFLERLDVLISKPGSAVPTRGSTKPLLQLIRAMESVGLDPLDWNIPTAVQEAMKEAVAAHSAARMKHKQDAADAPAEPGPGDPPESG